MRAHRVRGWLSRLCAYVTFVSIVGVAWLASAQPPASDAVPKGAVEKVAEFGSRCAVGIYCKKDEYSSFFGTGAVITPDGHVITSTTVVPPGATDIEVIFANYVTRPGKIVETNEPLETTIIKVEGDNLPCLSIAKDVPAVGTRAFTFSNANNVVRLSGVASFSMGIISGTYAVEDQGGESLYAGVAIETTAAVNPGSDGGPILNASGQLCAIISLNVSPSRWQGIGVPTKELLERLESFKSGQLKLSHEPLVAPADVDSGSATLVQQAETLAKSMVGVATKRKYPPEVLPRMPWPKFQATIADWDKKSPPERSRLLGAYYEAARLIEVNQMLRRPAQAASGVLISPDGFVLTSIFNVGPDLVFTDKATGKPHSVEFKGSVEELVKAPQGGFGNEANPLEKVTVILADGSEREAKLVAQHVPLGIALLKIDGTDLPHLNISDLASKPDLGMPVGLLGFSAGAGNRFTLNTGIVSAPSRNRGFQLQTDSLLNYGNSGGLAFDANGKWLGISTDPIAPRTVMGRLFNGPELNAWNVAPNSGVSLVARGDRIVEAIEELKKGKTTTLIPGPFLGVSPDQAQLFGRTVVIGVVGPDTPASRAGIQKGDRVLAINDEQIDSWNDMTEHLQMFKPGDKIQMKVERPGIVQRLVINGKNVSNDAELKAFFKSLKPGDKFEGKFESEDTKVVEIVLGERK